MCHQQDDKKKTVFELHVNARFDERVLAACFRDVATDKNLCTAKLRSTTRIWKSLAANQSVVALSSRHSTQRLPVRLSG